MALKRLLLLKDYSRFLLIQRPFFYSARICYSRWRHSSQLQLLCDLIRRIILAKLYDLIASYSFRPNPGAVLMTQPTVPCWHAGTRVPYMAYYRPRQLPWRRKFMTRTRLNDIHNSDQAARCTNRPTTDNARYVGYRSDHNCITTVAQLLQPSLAFCFSLQPMTAYRPGLDRTPSLAAS